MAQGCGTSHGAVSSTELCGELENLDWWGGLSIKICVFGTVLFHLFILLSNKNRQGWDFYINQANFGARCKRKSVDSLKNILWAMANKGNAYVLCAEPFLNSGNYEGIRVIQGNMFLHRWAS